MTSKSLRLIHSGRLLTDGILLLSWLRSLEERVRRQAGGVGGDVESVLKDVGLAEEDEDEPGEGNVRKRDSAAERVWLHCVVGAKVEDAPKEQEDEVRGHSRRHQVDTALMFSPLHQEEGGSTYCSMPA